MEQKQVKVATIYLTVYPGVKKRLRALAAAHNSN